MTHSIPERFETPYPETPYPEASKPALPTPPPDRRRRWTTWAAASSVALVVLAAAGLSAYLWVVADHANSRAAWYQGQLATTQGTLTQREASLTQTKAQLTAAQGQLRTVANEKAKAEDRIAADKAAEGLFVTANEATTKCADKLVEITHLPASASQAQYDGLSTELDGLCQEANRANDAVNTFLQQHSGG